jgi:hypothetical protein
MTTSVSVPGKIDWGVAWIHDEDKSPRSLPTTPDRMVHPE